jgi:flagellar biosynthetic protein FliR
MLTVYHFVGQMVDYKCGFAMVSVLDPVNQIQVPITGNLFFMMAVMVFIVSGGLNWFMFISFESYLILPPGHIISITESGIMGYMVDILVRYTKLAVTIAMPVIGALTIIDIGLGLLVKAAPQMNVFVIGIPIKVFVGLILVGAIVPGLISGSIEMINVAEEYVANVIWGLGQ